MADGFDSVAPEDDSGLTGVMESVSVSARGVQSSATGFGRAMTQAFSRAIVDGRRFDDVLKGLALRLSGMAVSAAFKPLQQGLGSGLQNLFSGLFSGGGSTSDAAKALEATMSDVRPFAAGGVIGTPTYFPLGGRGLGLAGEAGPEAILPLARGADGSLGVAAMGGGAANVTINIATPDAASFRRSESYVTGQIARAVARGQRAL